MILDILSNYYIIPTIIPTIISISIYYLYNKYYSSFNIVKILTNLFYNKKVSLTYNISSALLNYQYLGQDYIISIPYNRKKLINMIQYKAELFYNDKKSINITQQPGIPYILNAKDLGGEYIKITNMGTGLSCDYDNTQSPMYGDELIYQE